MASWGRLPEVSLSLALGFVSALSGCDSIGDGSGEASSIIEPQLQSLSREELLDPVSCQPCHPQQYEEWAASMHAYASEDPVFRALNQRGQRETNGALGGFCVQCHAPVAARLGLTEDGLNLDEVPQRLQGVTCVFCHQIDAVEGLHNNQLSWAQDGVMRGPFKRLEGDAPHRSTYSPHLDRAALKSSDLCGSCHDIVTPTGLHLERTYWEWERTIFNNSDPRFKNTCNDCHMPRGAAGEGGARRTSNHLMPGVDLHLTEHPGREVMREAIEDELRYSLLTELCVEVSELGGGEVELTLENISAGHRFPSGAALDRRVWVELSALSAEGELLWESGRLEEDEPVSKATGDVWLFRDQAFNSSGVESHFFWEIEDVKRNTLPGPLAVQNIGADELEDTHVTRRYRFGTEEPVAQIQLRVWIRPIGLELLRELVESGDLDEDIFTQTSSFELEGAFKLWLPERSEFRVSRSGKSMLCTF